MTLAAAISLALIAAAWLMATFCLNGIHRFSLPMGLFGLTMLLSTTPTTAQTKASDGYIVVFEQTKQPRIAIITPVAMADTGRMQKTTQPVKHFRTIRPVPAWPEVESGNQLIPESTGTPFILLVPMVKPGSSDVERLIGVRIRP